jgi:hypothetical protein
MTTQQHQAPPGQTRDPIAAEIDQRITAIREAVAIAQTGVEPGAHLDGAIDHLTALSVYWANHLATITNAAIRARHEMTYQDANRCIERATAFLIRARHRADLRADQLVHARREISGLDQAAADLETLLLREERDR